MTETHEHHSGSHAEVGYERKDINVWKTLIATAAVIAVIVVSVIFVDEIFVHTKERMIEQYVLKPESTQLRDLRAEEAEILTTYDVIDKNKGVYRIPISRAMKLMADEAYRQQAGGR